MAKNSNRTRNIAKRDNSVGLPTKGTPAMNLSGKPIGIVSTAWVENETPVAKIISPTGIANICKGGWKTAQGVPGEPLAVEA